MSKSIISNERKCLVCGVETGLHRHHVFYGTANRKKSEEDGVWCYLCYRHHNCSNAGVHFNSTLDKHLKQFAQKEWMKRNGTLEDFTRRYGRNYIDD